eukprot:651797-Rhodomonas_salina.1
MTRAGADVAWSGAQAFETFQCNTGFRAQASRLSFATCDLGNTYDRQCGFCEFYGASTACTRVQCAWTPEVDFNGSPSDASANTNANATVLYADEVQVRCNAGFRASRTIQPLANAPRTYIRACSDDCSLRTDTVGTLCRALSCGIPPLVNNAQQYDTVNALIHGGTPLQVSCNAGYRVDSSQSSFATPCIDSFVLRCNDGGFQSALDGVAYTNTRPSCVRHCGLISES